MKDYNPSTASSYLIYWNVSNLYGWVMSQILSVDAFEWRKDKLTFDKEFIQNYGEDSDNDGKYPKELHELHSDLPFLPERMNID